MVPRLIGFRLAPPRRRTPRRRTLSRSRLFGVSLCDVSCSSPVESLEDRTLLSASLALYNGSFAGSYKGVQTTDNNGVITTTRVTATALQSTFANGVVTVTIPGGTGTGTVESNGQISGTVNTSVEGQAAVVTFTGSVTAANNSTTRIDGAWSYSVNLGNGVTVSGQGTWTASAAPVVSDFDGNYAGTYRGTDVLDNNGTITKSSVSPTTFQALISNGTITDTFPSPTGLFNGTGTIGVAGNIDGTVTEVIDGVTVTITDSGQATRSLSGVKGAGTWSFSANLGGGETETGSGTWTIQSVLIADGAYSGSFNGSTVLNNNGVITTTPIPNEVSNLSVSLTISNGTVTLSAPGVPATGTGTIDQNGNITGATSFTVDGVAVTGQFLGTVVLTPYGNVITGTWTFSANLGGGVTETGSGTWTAQS
jgi:hypothetical protein